MDDISFEINVNSISLDINAAIPLGLIINEIVTNSLKHVFPNDKKGKIIIDLYLIGENKFKLTVMDNGVGFPNDLDFKNTKSLGLRLVVTLAEQIHGNIKLDKKEGTKFEIIFDTTKE